MTMKEAFHYQNILDGHIEKLEAYVRDSRNILNVTCIHKCSKALSTAEDYEEVLYKDTRKFDCSAQTVFDFLLKVIEEKNLLTKAIHDAKTSCPVDIDGFSSMNRIYRNVADIFKWLSKTDVKPSKETKSAYTFDADGRQVSYYYEADIIKERDFDKNSLKQSAKKLYECADEQSVQIENALINTEVNHTPIFDLNDSYDEILEDYIISLKAE